MGNQYNVTRLLKTVEFYTDLLEELHVLGDKKYLEPIPMNLSSGDTFKIINKYNYQLSYKEQIKQYKISVWNSNTITPEIYVLKTFIIKNGEEIFKNLNVIVQDLKKSAISLLKTAAVLTGADITEMLERLSKEKDIKNWDFLFRNAAHDVKACLTATPANQTRKFLINVETNISNKKHAVLHIGPDCHYWSYKLHIAEAIYLKLNSEEIEKKHEETNIRIKQFISNMEAHGIKMLVNYEV